MRRVDQSWSRENPNLETTRVVLAPTHHLAVPGSCTVQMARHDSGTHTVPAVPNTSPLRCVNAAPGGNRLTMHLRSSLRQTEDTPGADFRFPSRYFYPDGSGAVMSWRGAQAQAQSERRITFVGRWRKHGTCDRCRSHSAPLSLRRGSRMGSSRASALTRIRRCGWTPSESEARSQPAGGGSSVVE